MKKPGKLAALATLYFLPTIIGAVRRHRNEQALFALNLFSGWTVIGWVICLVWATVPDPSSY